MARLLVPSPSIWQRFDGASARWWNATLRSTSSFTGRATLVENATDIERAIGSFVSAPNGALVVIPDVTATVHRDLIIAFAAQHRLPAVYYSRMFVAASGLMSYGNDLVDVFRQAAPYVDRILRGDKPADLPVHAATEFETIINLKTAKALGVTVPPGLLVAADEVIE